MDEHRVIERVLSALERKLECDPRVDSGFVGQALDFLRNFADGCHHHKEEDELFPVLETAGVDGPIACMLHEHDQGRRLVSRIAEHLEAAGEGVPQAEAVVRAAATDYIRLLRFHIEKEDTILFRLADQILGEQAQGLMLAAFERRERETGDAGRHQRYLQLADSLYRQAFDEN